MQSKHTCHGKYFLPTTQGMTLHLQITRWSIQKSNWLYSLQPKMEKLYIICKSKTRSWLRSDNELLIAKFRLISKKVWKTTRPFKYDQNQIPYVTTEMTNRLKRLDLVHRVPKKLWTGSWHCIGDSDQNHPKEKERQNGCLRRPYK